MSHAATDWAIKQRGLKPAAKIVLWHLCDRYHKDHGCFPSQQTLADDCEMSRSALNHWLNVLEEAKLIRRVTRRHPKTHRQERTEYFFPFQPSEQEANESRAPCPESGHGSESGKSLDPSPENRPNRVRNRDSNPVREPVIEPFERVSARALNLKPAEDEVAREAAFQLFLRPEDGGGYPPGAIDDVEAARKVWADVDASEWDAAIEALPRFLRGRKSVYRGKLVGLTKYIRDTHWRRFPPPKSVDGRALDAKIKIEAFGRSAWALFARRYAAGKSVKDTIHWIRSGAEIPAPAEPTEAEEAALVPIKVGSAEHVAWRDHCKRLGFDLPMPDRAEWIFLPSEQPRPLKLAWKGYTLIEDVSIEMRGPVWWWRLFQPNAPLAELMADRSTGFVQISTGPLPLRAEIDAMVQIRSGDPEVDDWDLWFRRQGVELFKFGLPIWAPRRKPPAMHEPLEISQVPALAGGE